MLSGCPIISSHASSRAFERLGMGLIGFRDWVAATYREWMPVNAGYLCDRGLHVSAQGRDHYKAAWTLREHVALCLSVDHVIITVIPFAVDLAEVEPAPGAGNGQSQQKPLSPHEVAIRRIINDLGIRGSLDALLRPPGGLGDAELNAALSQYAEGQRDLFWLKRLVKMGKSDRAMALSRPTRVLTEHEKRFITPAKPIVDKVGIGPDGRGMPPGGPTE